MAAPTFVARNILFALIPNDFVWAGSTGSEIEREYEPAIKACYCNYIL